MGDGDLYIQDGELYRDGKPLPEDRWELRIERAVGVFGVCVFAGMLAGYEYLAWLAVTAGEGWFVTVAGVTMGLLAPVFPAYFVGSILGVWGDNDGWLYR